MIKTLIDGQIIAKNHDTLTEKSCRNPLAHKRPKLISKLKQRSHEFRYELKKLQTCLSLGLYDITDSTEYA